MELIRSNPSCMEQQKVAERTPQLTATVISLESARIESLTTVLQLTADVGAAACIGRAMAKSVFRSDLVRIYGAWPALADFSQRLVQILTDLVPGTDGRSLLADCLEACAFNYLLSPAAAERVLAPARYMAAGISVAARGLLAYQITAKDEAGACHPWSTLEGGLAQFAQRLEARELRFSPRCPASPEERYAMKAWLCNALLQYDDLVLLARAGIEPKSYDA